MQVSKFLKAAVFASALTLTGVASATTYSTTLTRNFGGFDLPFTTERTTEKVSISYTDSSFNLTGVIDPILTVLNGSNSGLFQSATLLKDADELFTWAPAGLDKTRFTFTANGLAAGNYTLKFNLLGGGFYTGSYTITPVPEPESGAMMLAGLVLTGLISRRKFSA